MGRYVIITNVWGRKPCQITKFYSEWNSERVERNPIFCDSEKVEFDSLIELKEYIKLFTEICNTFEVAEKKNTGYKKTEYNFDNPNKRRWGYLCGDRETLILEWGGDKLYHYNKSSDKRRLYDMLFRLPGEVPDDYEWDDGEYEGWLQFRWGDGKNAIGYVEPKKEKKLDDIAEDHSEKYERINELLDKKAKWIEEHPTEYAEYLDELVKQYEKYEGNPKFEEIIKLNRMISELDAEILADEDCIIDEEYERKSEFAEALEDAFARTEEKERIKLLEDRW